MSWNLLGKPKTMKVSKSLAKTYAEMEPAPHDRPLSERRLMVYHKLLDAGQFRPVTWASALCKETGELYRVNGKHTSTLLSGLDTLPDFYAVVEEYECDTLEDVAKLYATFDSGMQSRTARDIYCSFASTVPELRELPSWLISLSVAGLAYEKFGDRYTSDTQPAERAELILDAVDEVIWLKSTFAKVDGGRMHPDSEKLRRVPCVAAMIRTFRKAQKAATEFWSAVRDETGPRPETPDRKLARYLVQAGVNVGSGGRTRVIKGSNREFFVKSIHAWNAWRRNEPTQLKYMKDAKVPAVV